MDVSHIELMTTDCGQRVLAQTTVHEPREAIATLLPGQVALQWRQIVYAVSCSLAHLHALDIYHGAVRMDNVFRSGSSWRLGPTRCSGHFNAEHDMWALAHFVSVELKRFIDDPRQHDALNELAKICMSTGASAAHIAAWAEKGIINAAHHTNSCPPSMTLKIKDIASGFRLSVESRSRVVLLTCELSRVPQCGSLVPETQLDQLGTVHLTNSSNAVEIPDPGRTVAVFCASIVNRVAKIGAHCLIEPKRIFRHLEATLIDQKLELQWFWPTDMTCHTMRVQVRPDRYPQSDADQFAREHECFRAQYDNDAKFEIQIPQDWNLVYVRVSRKDQVGARDENAIYGSAERMPLKHVARRRHFGNSVRTGAWQA